MSQVKRWLPVGLLLILLVASRYATSQTITPTATAQSVRSIFADDTCAPPCWFGLTAGQSTVKDVDAFVKISDDFIWWQGAPDDWRLERDLQTGDVINGYYFFYWKNFSGPQNIVNSTITIRDGKVYRMSITMNDLVTLKKTLEAFGQPDHVRFSIWLYEVPQLELAYPEIGTLVVLTADADTCTMQNIDEQFWVEHINYYPLSEPEAMDQGPAVGTDVKLTMWQQWLANREHRTCGETWRALAGKLTATPRPTHQSTPTP